MLFRSLVQIKSHAQKVLKRLDAGENVFRRLDENYNNIDSLIVQAAKQRVALLKSSSSKSMSEAAKLKRVTKRPMEQVPKDSSLFIEQKSEQISPLGSFGSESQTHFDAEAGRGAVIAAAALCQLSSLGWNQKHQSTIQKSF